MQYHSCHTVIYTLYCFLAKSLIESLRHYLMTLICDDHVVGTYGRTKAEDERQ